MDNCKKQSDIDLTASSDCGNVNGLDLIRRQDAIDAMIRLQAEDIEMYGCEIPEGFDGDRAVMALRKLPSAELNIIRCKDCKWKQGSECVRFAEVRPFADDFCSRAERRTDEGFDK